MIIYESRKHRRNIHLLNTKDRAPEGRIRGRPLGRGGQPVPRVVFGPVAEPWPPAPASWPSRRRGDRGLLKVMVGRHMARRKHMFRRPPSFH